MPIKVIMAQPFKITMNLTLSSQQIHFVATDTNTGFKYSNKLNEKQNYQQYELFEAFFNQIQEQSLEIQNNDKQITLIFFKDLRVKLRFKGQFHVPNKVPQKLQNELNHKQKQKVIDFNEPIKEQTLPTNQIHQGSKQRRREFQKQALLDKNIEVKRLQKKAYPYNCLCLLKSQYQGGQQANGTGCILTPFIILTCAHNLYYSQTKKYFTKMYAVFGERKIQIKEARYHPQYYNKLISDQNNENYDFAVLLLDKPHILDKYMSISSNFYKNLLAEIPGFPLKYFEENEQSWANKQKIKNTKKSKIPFKNNNLVSCGVYNLYGSKDIILSFEKDLMLYKITTVNGQSGSPIIVELYGGYYFIVGIHIASIYQQKRNAGVRLTKENVDLILQWADQLYLYYLQQSISSSRYTELAERKIKYVPYEQIEVKEMRLPYKDSQYVQIQQMMKLQELIKDCQVLSIPIMNHALNIANYYEQNLQYQKAIKILKKILKNDQKAPTTRQIQLKKAEIFINLANIYRNKQKAFDKHEAMIPNFKYQYIKHNFYTNSRDFLKQAQKIYLSIQTEQSINFIKLSVQKIFLRAYQQQRTNPKKFQVIKNLIEKINKRLEIEKQYLTKQKLLYQLYKLHFCQGELLCKNGKYYKGIQSYQISLTILLQIYQQSDRIFIGIYRKCFKACFSAAKKSNPSYFYKSGIEYGYKTLTILKQNMMQNTPYGIKILNQYQECIKSMMKSSKDKTDIMKAIQALKIIYQESPLIKDLEYIISLLK